MREIIAYCLILLGTTFAQEWISGTVQKVYDGDTFWFVTSEGRVKVRLYGIDAPESKQEFGQESQQLLSLLIKGRVVNVHVRDTDPYGRTVGEVWLGDSVDVNLWMVRNGYAWWYRNYGKDRQDIGSAESAARREGLGVWAYAQPQAPWVWRAAERSEKDRGRR